MVRLYCFLRLNLNTMTLSPRACPAILPRTRADFSASPSTSSFESLEIASTRSNSTSAPTSPAIVSTSIVWPGATRYCFPPVSITAYITKAFWVGFPVPGEHLRAEHRGAHYMPLLEDNPNLLMIANPRPVSPSDHSAQARTPQPQFRTRSAPAPQVTDLQA